MAQNITIMGASYSDVPAVQLPKTGGGTARFDDASITTATASDVASGKVFLAADGAITTGTSSGGGGGDIPTFNIVWDSSWSSGTVTCDETFQQCWDRFDDGADNGAYVTMSVVGDPSTQTTVALANDGQSNDYVNYTISDNYGPYCDLVYHANGTIDMVKPSAYSNELNATANGDYYPSKGVYTHVVVNVPQPTGTKTINITSNGTTTEDVTNYANAQITVNVPGGGTNSWTKVAETSYQVSTTSTSAATVATLKTGDSSIWTSDKWVYVRIRDTEGKRNGYFYGTDTFFYNVNPINDTVTTSVTSAIRITNRYTNDRVYTAATNGPTGYGVYPDTIYNNGNIRIQKRYNSNSSFTVDGTYKVEVYLLDPPTGVPIFE